MNRWNYLWRGGALLSSLSFMYLYIYMYAFGQLPWTAPVKPKTDGDPFINDLQEIMQTAKDADPPSSLELNGVRIDPFQIYNNPSASVQSLSPLHGRGLLSSQDQTELPITPKFKTVTTYQHLAAEIDITHTYQFAGLALPPSNNVFKHLAEYQSQQAQSGLERPHPDTGYYKFIRHDLLSQLEVQQPRVFLTGNKTSGVTSQHGKLPSGIVSYTEPLVISNLKLPHSDTGYFKFFRADSQQPYIESKPIERQYMITTKSAGVPSHHGTLIQTSGIGRSNQPIPTTPPYLSLDHYQKFPTPYNIQAYLPSSITRNTYQTPVIYDIQEAQSKFNPIPSLIPSIFEQNRTEPNRSGVFR